MENKPRVSIKALEKRLGKDCLRINLDCLRINLKNKPRVSMKAFSTARNVISVHYKSIFFCGVKVYTEGFRVLLLNRRVIGCKTINLYPIVGNQMKYMFFL